MRCTKIRARGRWLGRERTLAMRIELKLIWSLNIALLAFYER